MDPCLPNTSGPTPVHISEMFIYVKHHTSPARTLNGGAVTSFVCSCSLNCFAATDRLIVVPTRAVYKA